MCVSFVYWLSVWSLAKWKLYRSELEDGLNGSSCFKDIALLSRCSCHIAFLNWKTVVIFLKICSNRFVRRWELGKVGVSEWSSWIFLDEMKDLRFLISPSTYVNVYIHACIRRISPRTARSCHKRWRWSIKIIDKFKRFSVFYFVEYWYKYIDQINKRNIRDMRIRKNTKFWKQKEETTNYKKAKCM